MYVVAVDNGGAPCAPDGTLTLGICKPAIRRKAKAGDRIVGISGRGEKRAETADGSKYPITAVIYAAIVEKVLSCEEYTALPRYEDRMDCLYNYSPAEDKFYRKEEAVLHTEADMDKDLPAPVVLCRDFRYFGRDAVPLSGISPRLQDLGSSMGRASRVCDLSMRKPADKKDLDKQDLVEFDKLFEMLWPRESSYTPPVLGSFDTLGRQTAARDCSKKDPAGGNGSGGHGRGTIKQCGARKQPNPRKTKEPATVTGRIVKLKYAGGKSGRV